jgi:hypothetical protein
MHTYTCSYIGIHINHTVKGAHIMCVCCVCVCVFVCTKCVCLCVVTECYEGGEGLVLCITSWLCTVDRDKRTIYTRVCVCVCVCVCMHKPGVGDKGTAL